MCLVNVSDKDALLRVTIGYLGPGTIAQALHNSRGHTSGMGRAFTCSRLALDQSVHTQKCPLAQLLAN